MTTKFVHVEKASSSTECAGFKDEWMILINGFQAGGIVDKSGAGDKVYDSLSEAQQAANRINPHRIVKHYWSESGKALCHECGSEIAYIEHRYYEIHRPKQKGGEAIAKADTRDPWETHVRCIGCGAGEDGAGVFEIEILQPSR